MGTEVMDFTDLGEGIRFSYKGMNFEVPSFTKAEMKNLIKISEEMVNLSKTLSEKDKQEAANSAAPPGEDMKEFFEAQQKFVLAGVRSIDPAGNLVPITEEGIENWPWRLVNKVSSLVQEMMGNVSSAEKDGDKGKNPTK